MIITNDIFNEMLGLRNVFDEFFTTMPQRYADTCEYPAINVHETGDVIEIRALLPGVTVEAVNLELHDRDLIISGERKPENGKHAYIRREREYGAFKRAIRLSAPVVPDRIEAQLKDGVLHVTLTKSEAAKPRRIEIK